MYQRGRVIELFFCVFYLVKAHHFLNLTFVNEQNMKGPEKELHQLGAFGELNALFPGIEVHIDFVGPAIPQERLVAHCNIGFSVSSFCTIWE